jgi:hypothetical protein
LEQIPQALQNGLLSHDHSGTPLMTFDLSKKHASARTLVDIPMPLGHPQTPVAHANAQVWNVRWMLFHATYPCAETMMTTLNSSA